MKQISLLFFTFVLLCSPTLVFGQGYTLTVSEHAVDIVEGQTTYRLYIDMINPEDKLSAIYGGEGEPLSITTSDGFFNDAFGGTSAAMINPALFGFFPAILADSWFTIGIESQPTGDESAISLVEGNVPLAAHFDASDALSGADLLIDDDTGGAWFALSDSPNGLPNENLQTLFMQLTIPTGGEICATVNAQIFGMGFGENETTVSVSFCGVGTFEPNSVSVTPGCTEAGACNFNPLATEDDGSCEFTSCLGCTDITACNFDADALIDDGSCDFSACAGCTNMDASNYDPNATSDDGSCVFQGCMDSMACNYDVNATESDDSCVFAEEGYDCSGNCLLDTDSDGICDGDEISGCSDVSACNYDSTVTEDDGSCDFCSCGDSGGDSSQDSGYTMTIEEHAIDLVPGQTTYRLYANLVNEDDFLSSVFGNSDNPFYLQSSDGFYNSEFGGSSADNINPAFFSFFPDLVADSWFTIGIDSTPVGTEVAISAVESEDQPWVGTFDFGSEMDGGDIVMDDETGGAWYVLNNTGNGLPDENGRVLLMQLTTSGSFSGTLHFQVFVNGNGQNDIRSSFDFDGVGVYNPNADSGGGNACGCTDPAASNYDSSAVYDDGSCDYTVLGCTDSTACNYDEFANVDDESCEYPSIGYDCDGCISDADMDGICDEFEIPGCTDAMACNYEEAATDDDGMCTFAEMGYDCLGNCVVDTDNDGVCDEFEILGCIDMEACNYNAQATDSDDSCIYPEPNYDCDGVCLSDVDMDGVCDALEVAGCQDPTACNYNPDATDDDDSCTYAETYYDCDGNCLSDQDEDGVCDELEIAGCTDATACNYNEFATDEDGSCSFAEPNYDCDGLCLNDADGDGICDEFEVPGCTDPAAENYNETATDDDGSCFYCDIDILVLVTDDVNSTNSGSIDVTISGGSGVYEFTWNGPDEFTSTDEDIEGLAGGSYSFSVTDSNGCTVTGVFVVEALIDNIQELGASFAIVVFPNPTSNSLILEAADLLGSVQVQLYDGTGRLIRDNEYNAMNGRIQLDVSGLATGTYHLIAISNGQHATERFQIR